MNREQMKFLKDRLSDLMRKKRWTRDESVPAAVVKAKRIVKKWEEDQQKQYRKRQERLDAAYSKVNQPIIFHEAGNALKALKEFEALQP